MHRPIRSFVNGLALATLLSGCGARVDTSSGPDSLNGGSSATTGGAASTSTSQLNGGITGTGGTTGPDPSYCNGLLLKQRCGEYRTNTDSGPIGCDIPLSESPPDDRRTIVVIDCIPQPLLDWTSADAGASGGYFFDHNQNPAHLILLGTSCAVLQSPGYHALDLIEGCTIVF